MVGFPNVPNVPGVPALPRLAGAVPAVVQLLLTDALNLLGGFGEVSWGLFVNNAPVITAQSVVSFDFKRDANISSFPVENGGFESYNKVQKPYDVRLRFSTGGSESDRAELLESAEAAVASLELMDAVTPEKVYPNVNPIHYDYRRTSVNGVGLLIVDVYCEEVRVRASSTFTTNSNSTTAAPAAGSPATGSSGSFDSRFPTNADIVAARSPGAAPLVNNGVVQPVVPASNPTLNFDFPL